MVKNLPGRRVLAIGAHPDDIEFGAYGTLCTFPERHMLILSNGGKGGDPLVRIAEAKASADLGAIRMTCGELPDTRLELTECLTLIETCIRECQPDVVLTMSEQDMHQDHETVAKASLIATRDFPGLVLAYATPSNHGRFSPQVFIGLDATRFERKMKAVLCHKSQSARAYLRPPYLAHMAKHWALMSRSKSEYVEAFEIMRWEV